MKLSFTTTMAGYAMLALIAGFGLEGKLRLAIWILLGGIAVKTLIARAARW